MRRRVGSLILAASLLLVLMPDTAMAARMEREAVAVQETAGREEKEERTQTGRTDASVAAGVPVSPVSLEGSGTAADPYRIKDAGQLRYFADLVNGVKGAPNTGLCAALTQNIDLSGVCGSDTGSWMPIGTDAHPYTGTFDGGSFTVSGLYFHNQRASCAGLFGCNAGTIRNLGVVGADIAAGSYTGGVCGSNRGTMTGCYNASSVSGDSYTGGVCGYNDGGIVSVCYNTGAVSGSKYVGGVCGYNQNEVSDCYNVGTVNGSGTSIGGICGYNKKLVSGCYNTGETGGANYVGSICGYSHSGSSLLNCYYLITGTEKGNYGTGMTQQQFASGEVCWLLNGGKSENAVWRQTCGAGFPAFGGKSVYQTQANRGDGSSVAVYTNEKNRKEAQPYAAPAAGSYAGTAGANTGGHVYREPEWEWDEEKYRSAVAVFTCQDCGERLRMEATISKKKTSTCGEEGGTVYTACVERDDKTYKDTRTDETEKAAHETLVWVRKSAATCEEPGYSKDCWTCLACGTCFADEAGKKELEKVRLRALGHKYEGDPGWTAAADYASAAATFVCARGCGKAPEVREVTTKVVKTDATCMTAGTTTYRAVVRFNGKNYKKEWEIPGQTLPHNYGGAPVWEWDSVDSPAYAGFGCRNKGCSDSHREPAVITTAEVPGTESGSPGKIIYTATVIYKGKTYRVTKEKELLAQHNLSKVLSEPATCGKDGSVEYWLCSVCGDAFADEAGTVPLTDIVIPATGLHDFKRVADDIRECAICGKTDIVAESGENQGEAGPDLKEEPALLPEGETPPQSDPEEQKEEAVSGPESGQEEQGGQNEQDETSQETVPGKQDEPVQEPVQDQPNEPAGDGVQSGQNEPAGDGVQSGQNGEDMQEESLDGVIDAQENSERYGIIYPEGQEPEPGVGTEGALEGNAVSFRAERAGTEAAQTAGKRQDSSLWASAVVLAVFAGMVLLFVLKRNDK